MLELYPLELIIETPHGVADFSPHMPTPDALRARPARDVQRTVALDGRTIVRTPAQIAGWDLQLNIPEEIGVTLARALPLQACVPGDVVRITENLTARDRRRIWENAVVVEGDSGQWFVGNPQDGDYLSIVMSFFVATGGI